MKHICLTALLFCCLGLATLAIAAEPHNSHPADGDPLLTLNFETREFSFTEVEVREQILGTARGWSLKGFLARHGKTDKVPFAIVLAPEIVVHANRQWNFNDENPNILAMLDEGLAITHFDLEPEDAAERTVLIDNVKAGMSGRVQWGGPVDKRFGEIVPGTRSPAHAAALLANALFTVIEYPEQVKPVDSEAPSFTECFEATEKIYIQTRGEDAPTICIKLFRWDPSGACSFSCKTYQECFEAGIKG